MQKKLSFYIESLDQGHIVTEGGKTKAIESADKVIDIIVTSLKLATNRLGSAVVRNMHIEITVEENCPTIDPKN